MTYRTSILAWLVAVLLTSIALSLQRVVGSQYGVMLIYPILLVALLCIATESTVFIGGMLGACVSVLPCLLVIGFWVFSPYFFALGAIVHAFYLGYDRMSQIFMILLVTPVMLLMSEGIR